MVNSETMALRKAGYEWWIIWQRRIGGGWVDVRVGEFGWFTIGTEGKMYA